jgi:hypothetical protein
VRRMWLVTVAAAVFVAGGVAPAVAAGTDWPQFGFFAS